MVVLGTTTMPIHQVMRLSRGAIIELDATEVDEVKILANNLPVASGGASERRQIKALAVINHWLTITWSGESSPI